MAEKKIEELTQAEALQLIHDPSVNQPILHYYIRCQDDTLLMDAAFNKLREYMHLAGTPC